MRLGSDLCEIWSEQEPMIGCMYRPVTMRVAVSGPTLCWGVITLTVREMRSVVEALGFYTGQSWYAG